MTAQFYAPPKRSVLPLRDYQRETIAALNQAKHDGLLRPLVALPTGSGKTVIFAHAVGGGGGRSLILVHRDELVRQTVEKLEMIAPHLPCGVIKADQNDVNAQVVVASVQTLSRANRLAQLTPDFRRVIVDEAHHATAPSYQRVMEHVGSFTDTYTIGFTATPERGDKKNIKEVWEEIVYHKSILWMIRSGYLVDVKGMRIHLKGFRLDKVKRTAGDFSDGDLATEMKKVDAPFHIAEGYVKFGENRPAICFTPTVAFAYDVAEELTKLGKRAAVVHANTPAEGPGGRQDIYGQIRHGELDVIVNCGVLTEGFDEPCISCVMVARPTQSRPFYTQIVGRGMRLHPGKTDCLVLDYSGVSGRYALATLAQLFDLDEKDLTDGVAVTEAVDKKVAAVAARSGRVDDDGSRDIDAKPVDLFSRKSINWIHTNDGGYLVSIPDGHMRLSATEADRFTVTVDQRDVPTRVVAENITLEYAQGIAEDEIRKNGWIGLVKADARWRQAIASEAQFRLLGKLLHRPLTDDERELSKGAASDLITKLMAEKPKRQEWF